MEIINVRNLSFTYPMSNEKALKEIDFKVRESDFVVVCGKSGCGKSTLLRHLKKNLLPYGDREGQIFYEGVPIDLLESALSTAEIGFVQQNPDNQIVTDKVWHELAFGLESLGMDQSTIKRRVSEMASFFDIQTWFRKDISELSGGQKQLLNLASVMVMQPNLLILDEPTSQLDPIAASEFLKVVCRINRELGTTVIISEHRLEELFTMADKVMVLDHGKIVAYDTPWSIGGYLSEGPHPMFHGLPAVMKIYSAAKEQGVIPFIKDGNEYEPLTIRDGRLWIETVLGHPQTNENYSLKTEKKVKKKSNKEKTRKKIVIQMEDVWFQYDKRKSPVLRGLSLEVEQGDFFCLLGGNGVGKSTTLKVLAGMLQPQEGKILVDGVPVRKKNLQELFRGHLAMVPQNPQALFTEITVEDELLEAIYYLEVEDDMKSRKVEEMLELMEIGHLRDSHPYDLSGGEQQRLALGKVLLLEPKILLLDEPTKGLDPFFKITLAGILKRLIDRGVTIFMVSHDIEFCAEYGQHCGMFFDGEIVSFAKAGEFFVGNNFYTTAANRMARKWFPDAVMWKEVVSGLVYHYRKEDHE